MHAYGLENVPGKPYIEALKTERVGLQVGKTRDGLMAKKGITGHDEWVVTEALATALVALEQLPPQHQPRPHMKDIRKLLTAGCQPGSVNLHLAQAKCRLFPDIDRLTIYQEYGLEDGQA